MTQLGNGLTLNNCALFVVDQARSLFVTVLTASTAVGYLVEVQGFERVAGSLAESIGLLLGGGA